MYNPIKWLDHITQFPNRRRFTNNSDGTTDIAKAQGTITQQGTAQSAANFNRMEDGIQASHIAAAVLAQYCNATKTEG